MPHAVLVKDLAREGLLELPPEELVLRVPYDLFAPTGAVRRRRGNIIAWAEGEVVKTGRVASARLGDTHPGERVLVHLSQDPDEWWLCEVEAVDGKQQTP